MLDLLKDLIRHKEYANSAFLRAVGQNEQAARDPELLRLLHHILIANRFWLHLFLGRPFVMEDEAKIPESLDGISARYAETSALELDWMARLNESDLSQTVQTSFMPGQEFSVAQGIMQVCLHSHGHRAQSAIRLKALGGTAPAMDFILRLKDRPS
jgi:uncharacterized damage-inducible protein DinB